MTTTGYKGMLRDRLPHAIDLALKYCRAKHKWIHHVYNNFIKIYSNKELRFEATRIVLGISKKNREFDFEKTILWEELNAEEYEFWSKIKAWVKWFQENHAYIENTYNICISKGMNKREIMKRLCIIHGIEEHTSRYLVDNFEKDATSRL